MATNTLDVIPPVWREWILRNVSRGCPLSGLVETLTSELGYSLPFARAAITEASDGAFTPSGYNSENMPDVDTSANTIRVGDREVQVLMTLKSPRIVLLGNVLSEKECDDLVDLAGARLYPSVRTELECAYDIVRSSASADIGRRETPWISAVEERLADLTHWPTERLEGLQIQHYQPGNEFQPHHDFFEHTFPADRQEMEGYGQRLATLLLYLSDVEAGGSTIFPGLGLEVRPKKGNALFFLNTDGQHVPDRSTLHGGSPVVRGVKVVANIWLRERFFT